MCKWCEKIQPTIRRFDYQFSKPIFLALAALHHNLEPDLGNWYQCRHDKMSAVCNGLAAIHETLLLPLDVNAIREIEEAIGEEMASLKYKMVEHPPKKIMRRSEAMNASTVTPSESASAKIRKWLEGLPEVEIESQISPPQTELHSILRKPLPDRHGSPIDPPSVIIKRSIRGVQAWFKACDGAVTPHHIDSADESLVSVMGGGVMSRPCLDVRVWKRTREPVGGGHPRTADSVHKGQNISDVLYNDPRLGAIDEIETVMSRGLAGSEDQSTSGSEWRRTLDAISAPVRSTRDKAQDFIHATLNKNYKAPACQTASSTAGESVWKYRNPRYADADSSKNGLCTSTSSNRLHTSHFREEFQHTPEVNKTPCSRGVCDHTSRGRVEEISEHDKSIDPSLRKAREPPRAIPFSPAKEVKPITPTREFYNELLTNSEFLSDPDHHFFHLINARRNPQSWSTSGSIFDPDLEAMMQEREKKKLECMGLLLSSDAEESLSSTMAVLDCGREKGVVTKRTSEFTRRRTFKATTRELDSEKASETPPQINSTLQPRCAPESTYQTPPMKENFVRHVDSLLLLPIPATKKLLFRRAGSELGDLDLAATTLPLHHAAQSKPSALKRKAGFYRDPSHLEEGHVNVAAMSGAKTVVPASLENAAQPYIAALDPPQAHYKISVIPEGMTRRRVGRTSQSRSPKVSSQSIHKLSSMDRTSKRHAVSRAAHVSDGADSENQAKAEGTVRRPLRRLPRPVAAIGALEIASSRIVPAASHGKFVASLNESRPAPVIETPVLRQEKPNQSQLNARRDPLLWPAVGTLGVSSDESIVMSTVEILSSQRTTPLQSPITTMDNANMPSGSSSGSGGRPKMPKPSGIEHERKEKAAEEIRRASRHNPTATLSYPVLLPISGKRMPPTLSPGRSNATLSMHGAEMDFATLQERRRVKRSMNASAAVPIEPPLSIPSASMPKLSSNTEKRKEEETKIESIPPLHKKRRERGPDGRYREGERARYWRIEKA
ncbi:uncharacterized protein PAC_05708 [Phialocephala subalpina]|uniref:Uncharacterized protein n=1 Tax=Phialocephala subalpina TaxID=576137 RepID=A0A1L7WSR8_9HELO|nr:uncharacterized protein PAC_05708 [Phialocephala subalpina]